MVTTRERWIDEARGYALILVILGHMGISYFGQYFTSCHLPIFYFLSGYLFSAHDNFLVFVKKKSKRLLIPYFFFGVILIICSLIFGNKQFSDLLFSFIIQKRMYTIWFLTSLFFTNIVFYAIVKIVKATYLVIGIALLLYIIGVLYYKNSGPVLFWNIDTVFITTIWFSVGYAMKKSGYISNISSKTQNKRKLILLAISFGLVYIILVALNWELCHEKFDIAMCTLGIAPLTLLASFSGIAFVIIISLLIEISVINYLGKNTMVYFALHQSMILPIIALIYSYFGLFQNESLLSDGVRLIVSILFIFLSLYPIDKLLNKTKLKILIGK